MWIRRDCHDFLKDWAVVLVIYYTAFGGLLFCPSVMSAFLLCAVVNILTWPVKLGSKQGSNSLLLSVCTV